jgi:hypothetical protein
MIELDRGALARGVAVAAVIAVPAALVGLWASDRDNLGWLGGLAVVVVLAGLAAGAAVAAHRQHHGAPLTHGVLTAATLFVAIQLVGVIRRAVAGDDISWRRIVSGAVLALVAGAIGGLVGGRLDSRTHRMEHR